MLASACVVAIGLAFVASLHPLAFISGFAGHSGLRVERQTSFRGSVGGIVTVQSAATDASAIPAEFGRALQGGRPFVVSFSLAMCGPCKLVAPVMDALQDEFQDKIDIMKLDVGEYKALAGAFNVRKVPSVLLFAGGSAEPVETFSGVSALNDIRAAVQGELAGGDKSSGFWPWA